MTLGEIIKEYRILHGLSQDAVAERAGLSKAYISILERNKNPKTGEPPIASLKTINAIAQAINSDFDTIFSKLDPNLKISISEQLPQQSLSRPLPANVLPKPQLIKKPRLGTIACGKPILAVELAEEFDEVPADIPCDFTLRCRGDSMVNARIYDGDIVYIRKQEEVENGQIAAVRIGEEATLKKVYYNGQRIILRACNPLFPDMEYEGEALNDIEILGKAVAFTGLIRTSALPEAAF